MMSCQATGVLNIYDAACANVIVSAGEIALPLLGVTVRVLIITWPWPSYFYPIVPQAWALAAAGHDVRVATQPSGAGMVNRVGLLHVACGEDTDVQGALAVALGGRNVDGEPRIPPLAADAALGERLFAIMVNVAESAADEICQFAGAWRPDLVVYDPVSFAGPLVATLEGIPAIRHLWGPDYFGLFLRHFVPAAAEIPFLRFFGRYGIADPPDPLGTATVDCCPASMQLAETGHVRIPTRYVPFNGTAVIPAWLGRPARRPRICVTAGTSNPVWGAHLFRVADQAAALAGLGAETIVAISSSDRSLVGRLPTGTRIAADVPLRLLLEQCDLLVSHGGTGTIMTGACAGVPQLTIPTVVDMAFNGRRHAATGAGLVRRAGETSPADLREAAAELLSEEKYRVAATTLRNEIMAQPPPAVTAARLEQIACSAASAASGARAMPCP